MLLRKRLSSAIIHLIIQSFFELIFVFHLDGRFGSVNQTDSVYYVETKTNNQERIDISNVYRIITKNHGQGAVEGLLGGLLIWGSLVGVSLLLVTAFPDDPSVEDGPGGGLLVHIAIKGGAPLPILGTLIGAAAASKNITTSTTSRSR